MTGILLAVLGALVLLLGVHLVFGAVALCAAAAAVVVWRRGSLSGWGVVPRGAA